MVNPNDCLFCKIANNEIPANKIYENSDTVAFLDINPASEGHTLVICRTHYENIFDVPEQELANMMATVKKVALSLKENLGYDDINIIQNTGKHAGQIVSHAHFHVIGRKEGDAIFLKFPRAHADESALDAAAIKIKISLSSQESNKKSGKNKGKDFMPEEETASSKPEGDEWEDEW